MSAEQPLILSKKGTPFNTKEQAQKHLKAEELDSDKHRVIPHQGRYAILDIDSPNAKDYLDAETLAELRGESDPTGPASTAPKEDTPVSKTEAPKRKLTGNPEEDNDYSWVKFLPSGNPNDPRDIVLSHNGVVLQFKRGVKVPIPRGHLEAARNAVHHTFRQEAGMDRQVGEPVSRAPYSYMGVATAEDYFTQFKAGNKLRNEVLERMRIEEAKRQSEAVA